MEERAVPKPVEKVLAIACREDIMKRVFCTSTSSCGAGEKVEIVIPEHGDPAVAEAADEPKHVERRRAAVYEIAGEPESISIGAIVELYQQRAKLFVATLNVADHVSGHDVA
jgi:hypothetical protein